MRRSNRLRYLLAVLTVVLFFALRHAYVDYRRDRAIASVFNEIGEHACCREPQWAIGKLADLLNREPDCLQARFMLAEMYDSIGDRKNEELQYRLATQRVPRNPKVHRRLGEFLMLSKRYKEAIRPLRRSAELDDDCVEVWQDLGRSYERSGRTRDAVDAWRRVLALDPDDGIALRAVARLDPRP